eukprot:1155150-Pelagomonas_calceolata.AAC.5
MSGEAQLNQRSDGVVIKDSACHIKLNGVQGHFTLPLYRVYKDSTGTALVLGKEASTIGKIPVKVILEVFSGTSMPCSWSFSLQQASMATRNEPCPPLLKASEV